jgi:hypothetical protein
MFALTEMGVAAALYIEATSKRISSNEMDVFQRPVQFI